MPEGERVLILKMKIEKLRLSLKEDHLDEIIGLIARDLGEEFKNKPIHAPGNPAAHNKTAYFGHFPHFYEKLGLVFMTGRGTDLRGKEMNSYVLTEEARKLYEELKREGFCDLL